MLVIKDNKTQMFDCLWPPSWIRLTIAGAQASSIHYEGVKRGAADTAEQLSRPGSLLQINRIH